MRSGPGGALQSVRLFASSLLAAALLVSGRAGGATKSDVLDSAVKAADRLPTIRSVGRNWEDVPYLVGLLLVAQQLEERTPGSSVILANASEGAALVPLEFAQPP